MISKIQLLFSLFLVVTILDVSGQKMLRKAEIQVESGDMQSAIKSYKKYISEAPTDYMAIGKLADLLHDSGSFADAEKYYKLVPDDQKYDLFHKNFGLLLKRQMRYDEALVSIEKFSQNQPELGKIYIDGLSFAKKEMTKTATVDIIVMPTNSSGSDFGLTMYKNNPVFSSFREDILMTEVERELSNSQNIGHKSLIYQTTKNRINYIKGINNKIIHVGPLSFSENGQKCALLEGKIVNEYCLLKSNKSTLYLADINDKGEITSSKPFEFNEVNSSINSVHLAFDGSALYFSSDRAGGFGGYDIYVSYYNQNKWSLPRNLGPNINTEADEVTPFLDGDKLYFASDFQSGIGGFDIFISSVQMGDWSTPVNAGNGINSPEDDYFPFLNKDGDLYFTSNRLGGRGLNDIYKTENKINAPNPEVLAAAPEAVSLEILALETQKNTVKIESDPTTVSLRESSETKLAFEIPKFNANKVGTNAMADMSLVGAHRIAMDEIIPNTEVFFIQLASMSASKPNFAKFKPLLKYGNIYKMFNNNSIKVRLGYFTDRSEAEDILTKVRANGYKDAFIAFEILNTAKMELILSSKDENSFSDQGNFNTKNPEVAKEYKSGNKYKVRLASYEDPIWFDVNKVKDLGRIEQWTKGDWIIFILAGYNSLDEAKKAQIAASNRGFKTSEVVIDNGGVLERLKQN
jgi:tetratricopeptide (TPR) repeat protein